MELTEDKIVEKCGKQCKHCTRNTLLPYEYEWSLFACGNNVTKRKNDLTIFSRGKINFIDRLKYAEPKVFCTCTNGFKIYEGDDINYIYEAISKFKEKK